MTTPPLLDNNNCIRCGERIHNVPLCQLFKFSFLLPAKHSLTYLIIHSTHLQLLHSGTNCTLTALRQELWIPTARQTVKSVIRKCTTCKKYSDKFYPSSDPAPLLEIRVRDALPFTINGYRFHRGIVGTREQSRTESLYLSVYMCNHTCFFYISFRRFASRRSLPSRMVSYNASMYQSAAEELQKLFKSPVLTYHLSTQGVQW